MVSRPVALGLTLCDYVIVEERTKKVSLIGTFGRITVDRFPTLAPPFCAFAVLTEGRGDADIDLVVSRLDTGEETYALHRRVHFPDDPLIEVGYVERIR